MSLFPGFGATRVDPTTVNPPPRVAAQPSMTAARYPTMQRINPVAVGGNANAAGFGVQSDFSGKLSLGMVGSIVVLLVLLYMWTRNVQGGG